VFFFLRNGDVGDRTLKVDEDDKYQEVCDNHKERYMFPGECIGLWVTEHRVFAVSQNSEVFSSAAEGRVDLFLDIGVYFFDLSSSKHAFILAFTIFRKQSF
jgi:hypothetical protein